ncbi:MAG: uracil-DNA glycosylase family protein [Campylobacter sp.]
MNESEFLRQLAYFKAFGYKFVDYEKLKLNAQKAKLSQLNSQIKNCNLCQLCKSRNSVVLGVGSQNAKVVFALNAPNSSDDESGILFSNSIGAKFYEQIWLKLGLKKDEIFVTTMLKCKPTNTSNLDSCFELCQAYFQTEILNINPNIVVALGEEAFSMLTKDKILQRFESIRGNVIKFGNMLLMPTFSPFWIAKNPSKQDIFLQDLSNIRRYL